MYLRIVFKVFERYIKVMGCFYWMFSGGCFMVLRDVFNVILKVMG